IFLLNLGLFLIFFFTRTFFPFLVWIHTLSLIGAWLLIGYEGKLSWSKYRWDVYLAVGLFVLALVLRLWQIDTVTPGMYSDEVTVAQHGVFFANYPEMPPWAGEPYVSDHHWHPTPLEYLIAWSIGIFGKSITAIRFPLTIIGALDIVLFYVLLRQFFS